MEHGQKVLPKIIFFLIIITIRRIEMKKSSKRQRGPVAEEITEAPMIAEPLEPEEVGIQVYIYTPKHSKSARKLAEMQFREGKVSEAGAILLPDGKTIKFGATCKTEMCPELKKMLIDGVFLAGKCPRRS
jgi:hypothetical protein